MDGVQRERHQAGKDEYRQGPGQGTDTRESWLGALQSLKNSKNPKKNRSGPGHILIFKKLENRPKIKL